MMPPPTHDYQGEKMSEMDRSEFVAQSVMLNAGLAVLLHQRMPDMDNSEIGAWIQGNALEGNSARTRALVAFAAGKVSKDALEIAMDDEDLLDSVASLADEDAYKKVCEIGRMLTVMLPDATRKAERLLGEQYDNEHARET